MNTIIVIGGSFGSPFKHIYGSYRSGNGFWATGFTSNPLNAHRFSTLRDAYRAMDDLRQAGITGLQVRQLSDRQLILLTSILQDAILTAQYA